MPSDRRRSVCAGTVPLVSLGLALCFLPLETLAETAVDQAACLVAPTQSCVFAIALAESVQVRVERLLAHLAKSPEEKANSLEMLKSPEEKRFWDQQAMGTTSGFKIVAVYQTEAGLLDGAMRTVEIARSRDEKQRDEIVMSVAEAVADKGDVGGVRRVIKLIGIDENRARAAVNVAAILAKAGHMSDALDIVAIIESPQDKARALTRIALLQWQSGDRRGAEATMAIADRTYTFTDFEQMMRIELMIEAGMHDPAVLAIARIPNPKAYARSVWERNFAREKAKDGEVAQAYAHFDKITDARLRKRAQFEIPGLLSERPGLVNEAIRRIEMIDDPRYRSSALVDIARNIASRGDMDGAIRVIGMLTEPHDINRAYFLVADVRARVGAIAEAERLIDKIGVSGRDRIYGDIAVWQARAGNLDAARHARSKISPDGDSIAADEEIAVALARVGRVREGLEAALDHWQFGTRIRALCRIAVGLGTK